MSYRYGTKTLVNANVTWYFLPQCKSMTQLEPDLDPAAPEVADLEAAAAILEVANLEAARVEVLVQKSPKANHESEGRGLHANPRAVPVLVPPASHLVPLAGHLVPPADHLVPPADHLEPSLRPSSHSPVPLDSVQQGSALTRERADATNEQRNIKIKLTVT